ncbi:MAG: universal stress protein [Acidobacteriota bacterium]
MYEKICVSLDSSPQARAAASFGLLLGKEAGEDARVVSTVVDELAGSSGRRERLWAALPEAFRPAESAPNGAAASEADETATWLGSRAEELGLDVERRDRTGRAHEALLDELNEGEHDVIMLGAGRSSLGPDGRIGSTVERLVRELRTDAFIVRDPESLGDDGPGIILVCIDGSPQSYAGLLTAIDLAKQYPEKTVEAVAVYDPYLHYTLFNGIVDVLSEKASKVFKFADQEKLHEEIIDTGLAKIYQAHLEVARSVAKDHGVDLKITLLDGKAHQKILKHAHRVKPWLTVCGRIGVHSQDGMDIGATAENLLRQVPGNVLMVSRKHVPSVDTRAAESVEWVDSAVAKMQRVPSFVRGVARTAVIRWAIERGHSIITPSVINSCMGDILPPSAAQAMGYVAEELAKEEDDLTSGKTFICHECGYSARDYRPVKCPVCDQPGPTFQQVDRDALEKLGNLKPGLVEETFDGKKLHWSQEAKAALHRVPPGYERRRSRARVEKTAKVRGLKNVTEEFVIDMIQQEVADASYLSEAGEGLKVEFKKEERADDQTPRQRGDGEFRYTDAAWQRLERVPAGFMRDMTMQRVEQFAAGQAKTDIDLALCEEGIAEGRRMMAEMIGAYGTGDVAKDAIQASYEAQGDSAEEAADKADKNVTAAATGTCPMHQTEEAKVEAAAKAAAAGCPAHADAAPAEEPVAEPVSASSGKCPVDHASMGSTSETLARAAEVVAEAPAPSAGKCPVDHAAAPSFTEKGEEVVATATARATDAGKFESDRAEALIRGVAQERAKAKNMEAIGQKFMAVLGKKLGYGHPLAEITAQHEFTWTPEALAELENIPDFCRELTKWRVEWTAVKKDLGTTITPEVMSVKYDMWGEVSDDILARGDSKLEWLPEAEERIANIPDFVKGQVVQSVEGNAREWGFDKVSCEVLDRVIQKWIDTGDFHEGQYGYK